MNVFAGIGIVITALIGLVFLLDRISSRMMRGRIVAQKALEDYPLQYETKRRPQGVRRATTKSKKA